jgi:hypothetical protein
MCYKDEIPSHRLAFDLVGVLDGHDTETASDMVSQRLPGEVSGRLKKGDTIAEANTASMAKLENDLKSITSSAGTCVLSCAIAGRFVWCQTWAIVGRASWAWLSPRALLPAAASQQGRQS